MTRPLVQPAIPSRTQSTPVTLTILDSARPPTLADVDVVVLTRPERMKRAVARLGAVWGAAILSVAIPILHFVLVPGLLLLGPVVAVLAFRARVRADVHSGIDCPKCGSRVSATNATYGWPLRLACVECGSRLTANPRS